MVREVSCKSKLPTPTIFAGFKPGFTLKGTASNCGVAEEKRQTTTMHTYLSNTSVLSLLLSISAFLLPHLTHSRHHRIDRIHDKPDHGLAHLWGKKKTCLEDAGCHICHQFAAAGK